MLEEKEEKYDLVPPEVQFLSAQYMFKLPIGDKHLKDPWKLRLHVSKLMERKVGDYGQVTSLKVKQPSSLSKWKAQRRGEEPEVQILVTVKF